MSLRVVIGKQTCYSDRMALPRYIPHYTVSDYQQWEGDWELWSGVAVAMSPSAKRIHQRLCGRLFRALSDKLESSFCSGCEVVFEVDWIISEDTVFRPDLLIVCDHRASDFVEDTPTFVAEVLSDSTRQRDLLYKREAYQELGVKYYLIVDPRNRSLQLLVNGDGGYEPCKDTLITLNQDCRFEIQFDGLFD